MRKKVLFIITKSNFGGAQRYVYDLAHGLDKKRFDVVVAAGPGQGSTEPGGLFGKLTEAGIRTVFIPELARDVSFADIAALRALYSAFKHERPDVVHLNSSKAGGLGALAARIVGIPRIIFTSHGLAYDEPRSAFVRVFIALFTWLTFILSHSVICISDDTAKRARKFPFCRGRVHKIYNGIEAPTFLPITSARKELLSHTSASVASDAIWIGTIAELVPNKGLGYALRVCDELKRSGRKYVFFIIGSGDLHASLTHTIEMRGLAEEVRMIGHVPQAARLLKAFDIFTLTSRKEGLPYVMLEAGHAGIAVTATDIPGNRDIVENGISGALCDPRDPGQCADTLCELMDDDTLRTRFGTALKARVEHDFDIAHMVSATSAVYSR